MKYKKHILIAEDDMHYFRRLKNAIEANISGSCLVYPRHIDDTLKSFEDFHYLIGRLNEHQFDEVLSYFNLVDIFIIDIHLFNSTDTNGIKFAYAILKEARDVKIILISTDPTDYQGLIENNKVVSFQKRGSDQKSSLELAKLVAKVIEEMFEEDL